MMELLDRPSGEVGKAYALQSLCGEIIYIPHSKSAMRLLVTGKESENAFALVGTGGSEGDPIGFHFHREAHDIFLCLQGQVNIWAGEQARTLNPGDFASVPPGVIHRYQILGDHTEFIGLIVPGGWEEFFRFIGEPYAGPMWPLTDDRNPFEVLIPKLKAAAEKFDMVPQPQHPGFPIQPWDDKADVALPGSTEPYFLRGGKGPKYLVSGTVVSPLATTKESNGRFAIASIEGSSWHKNEALQQKLSFKDAHHAFYVVEGAIDFTIDGAKTRISQWETVYIPKGTQFQIKFASRFAKAYAFASGAGLVEFLCSLGEKYEFPVIPEKEATVDTNKLSQLTEQFCK